ncbi:MAG: hypothetical protein ABIT04_01500 [Novosphingobium sp.]
MVTMIDRWWMWVIANLIGMALFLYLAVQTWIEPELANEQGASGGEGIVWGMTALPILLLFMPAHFIFGFLAHRQRERSGSWRGELFVGGTLLIWIAVFVFDSVHHGA